MKKISHNIDVIIKTNLKEIWLTTFHMLNRGHKDKMFNIKNSIRTSLK